MLIFRNNPETRKKIGEVGIEGNRKSKKGKSRNKEKEHVEICQISK
jgi:hypothetical protein